MLTCLFLVEMATRFSKKKLAEMKEKMVKSIPEEGGFISKRHRLEKKVKDEVIKNPEGGYYNLLSLRLLIHTPLHRLSRFFLLVVD